MPVARVPLTPIPETPTAQGLPMGKTFIEHLPPIFEEFHQHDMSVTEVAQVIADPKLSYRVWRIVAAGFVP